MQIRICDTEGHILVTGRYRDMTEALELNRTNFRNVDFRGIDLRDLDFRDAGLSGAYFKNAYLKDADFLGVRIENTRFAGANLQDVCMIGVIDVKQIQC